MALCALGPSNASYNPSTMRRPPITIKCECGETEEVAYGERWRCERCGRSWNTQNIPAEEYEGLLRRMRRHKLEVLAAGGLMAAVLVPLIVVVSYRFIGVVPMVMAAWLFVVSAVLAAQVPPLGARRAPVGAPPRLAC